MVARQTKKVILFLDLVRCCPVLRAQPVDEVTGFVELLATNAVKPGIDLLVDVAVCVGGAPQFLDAQTVARVHAGTDETVGADVECIVQIGEPPGILGDELGNRKTGFLCG